MSVKFDATFRTYQELSSDPRGTRDQWLRVISSFVEIHHKARTSEAGKRSLFFAGRSCLSLYRRSAKKADLDQAIRHLNTFVRMHRSGPYHILGLQELKEAHLLKRRLATAQDKRALQQLTKRPVGKHPGSSIPSGQSSTARQPYATPSSEPPAPHVSAIQSGDTSPDTGLRPLQSGRIEAPHPQPSAAAQPSALPDPGAQMQILSRDRTYNAPAGSEFNCTGNPFFRGLKESPKSQPQPVRNASLPPATMTDAPRPLKFEHEHVPPPPEPVRETTGSENKTEESQPRKEPPETDRADAKTDDKGGSPACSVSGDKYVVVIDPGHGGKDPGAVSNDGQLKEKEVTLKIAQRIKERLEQTYPGITVALTRKEDTSLPLQERTAYANSLNADIFVSIHCNAAEDASSRGIETYYLSKASSTKAMASAARENGIPADRMSDIDATLLDLLIDSKKNESVKLAETVHHSLMRTVAETNAVKRDRGVKRAPFYVLLGAKMPAILVECGFINGRERDKLKKASFLDNLAGGITDGIGHYLQGLGDKT